MKARQGWLLKRSGGIFPRWQVRHIYYFSDIAAPPSDLLKLLNPRLETFFTCQRMAIRIFVPEDAIWPLRPSTGAGGHTFGSSFVFEAAPAHCRQPPGPPYCFSVNLPPFSSTVMSVLIMLWFWCGAASKAFPWLDVIYARIRILVPVCVVFSRVFEKEIDLKHYM